MPNRLITRARVEIKAALAAKIVHEPETDAVILALMAAISALRPFFNESSSCERTFSPADCSRNSPVVMNEDADALLGIGDIGEPRLSFSRMVVKVCF